MASNLKRGAWALTNSFRVVPLAVKGRVRCWKVHERSARENKHRKMMTKNCEEIISNEGCGTTMVILINEVGQRQQKNSMHTHRHGENSSPVRQNRKSVVYGKSESVSVDLGGRRISKKNK